MIPQHNLPLISQFFTWGEALWLPSWKRFANEHDGLTDSVGKNLEDLFNRLDVLRVFFDRPISVHCAYRPELYNTHVGGAKSSSHMAKANEAAVDFHVVGLPCSEAITYILENQLLDHLDLRMENNGETPAWIHLDTRAVAHSHARYFIP